MNIPVNSLPLSWQYTDNDQTCVKKIPLLFRNQLWFPAGVCSRKSFDTLVTGITSKHKTSYLFRGCDTSLTQYLYERGFDKIMFGREAILEFSRDHFTKKSLKELKERGNKKGRVIEVIRTDDAIKKLNGLRKESKHGNEPQLQHLFITEFKDETRLFVFIGNNGEWLGGILITTNTPDKFHTELLLRKKSAPVGVMEALIYETFQLLKNSGKNEFSLGEVPFIVDIPISRNLYRDFILNKTAKLFRFAYNYKGLYNFKNKFNPRWEDVYICGYPKLRLSHIAGIIIRSNLLRLTAYKLLRK